MLGPQSYEAMRLLGHLSNSGDHCYGLASVIVRRSSVVVRRALTSSSELLGQS